MIYRQAYISFLLLLSLNSYANNKIEVCSDCKVNSIKEAIKQAKNGDVVEVQKGIYNEESIVINKSIKLIGIDQPIIDGKDGKNDIIIVNADSVTISGFVIQNTGESYLKDLSGIRVKKSKFFTIKNNQLNNTMFAIYLANSTDGVVKNNTIKGNAIKESSSGNGIHAWQCKRLFIKKNSVIQQRDGIYFEFVYESSIEENISKNNLRYGLHFMFSNSDQYLKNVFQNNGAGVAVMFSKEIDMFNNTFIDNWGTASFGLLLKEIYDAEIKGNDFIRNTIAVRLEGTSRINYTRNNFINNGWAMKINGGCYDNKVSESNFIANSFDISIEKGNNNNTFQKNFWSEYAGYDLDKDGFGDIPYHPVKLFNYVVNRTPETVVLLRSLFIDIINFSEKVSPIFTPVDVIDDHPYMKKIEFGR